MAKKDKTAVQILKDARNLLVKKGWHQGSEVRIEGIDPESGDEPEVEVMHLDVDSLGQYKNEKILSFCSIGAVDYAGRESVACGEARALLNLAMGGCNDDGAEDIVDFNDSEDTKKKDVLKRFDNAIKIAGIQADLAKLIGEDAKLDRADC